MPSVLLVFNDDGSVTWKPAGSSNSGGGGRRYNWIEGPTCPQHGAWKVVPGGWSEKKQANYDAFYVCKDQDCPNRPGRDWTSAHPADEGPDDPFGDFAPPE